MSLNRGGVVQVGRPNYTSFDWYFSNLSNVRTKRCQIEYHVKITEIETIKKQKCLGLDYETPTFSNFGLDIEYGVPDVVLKVFSIT